MKEEFEAVRLPDLQKDIFIELPVYDQLDRLITLFVILADKEKISITSLAHSAVHMRITPPQPNEINEAISRIRWLLQQLLEDKYITGDSSEEINERQQEYKPTLKAYLVKDVVGGYRWTIWKEKSEERNVYYMRKHTVGNNIKLLVIFSFTMIFAGLSAFFAGEYYFLEANIHAENSQSKYELREIKSKDLLIQKKDQDLFHQQIQIDSLIILYEKKP